MLKIDAIADDAANLFIEATTKRIFWKLMDLDSMLFAIVCSKIAPVSSQAHTIVIPPPVGFFS